MILLDTHIWLRWLLPPEPLPARLIAQIEQTDNVMISAISCWEATMLEQRGRISLPLQTEQWLQEATEGSQIDVLPITCDILHLAAILPQHHKDPADRFIIATALIHNLKLMSLDGIFPTYEEIGNSLIN